MHSALELLHPIITVAWIVSSLSVIGLGLWLASSHLPREASILYFCGISVLAVSVVFVYPALMRTHLGQNVRTLQDLAHIAREDLDAERAFRVQDRRSLIRQKEELDTTKSRVVELENNLASEKQQFLRTKDDAAKLADTHAALSKRAAAATARHIRTRATLIVARRALIKERLAHAETKRLADERVSALAYSSWLEQGLSTERYAIRLRAKGLVDSYEGRSYDVDILKTQGASFIFAPKQFTLGLDEPYFLESLRALSRDVLTNIRNSHSAKLLLRGHADAGGPLGSFPAQFGHLRSIEYLAALPDRADAFGTRIESQLIQADYHNDHLPLLRSGYIRSLVARVDPDLVVVILEGDAKGAASTDRRVDMFLQVTPIWPLP